MKADAGGSGIISGRKLTAFPANSEHFEMKVPNNKVGNLGELYHGQFLWFFFLLDIFLI